MSDTANPNPANESASAAKPAASPAANPADELPPELRAPANTTSEQPVAHDRNHEQNEVSGASRGEFGRQDLEGATKGGYSDEPSRGTQTYAGSVTEPAATTGYVGERAQTDRGFPSVENGSFGTVAVGAGDTPGSAVGASFGNDNDAPQGTDSGYAANYGTSSLGGTQNTGAQPDTTTRNQREDYTPGHPEGGPVGQRTGQAPTNADTGRDEAEATPPTTADRSGYEAAGSANSEGSEAEGFGTKGGSYNDEYDGAEPGQPGSPAKGDHDQQEAAKNYGAASDQRTNAPDSPDYGSAPGQTSSPDKAV
ncbi:hypothetical protein CDA63_12020 [Hymenobacter amundsenii]|uniref:Uncharacterized protein n=1 Tax=Hymenobacter amundsenii TaxID=2006685 RepID=A0A246FK65_9BACT|nr:hypothetical protein [Hymenobacter amundsenii]OWP62938.1 hypothetical protein CDA63_12020 [Hymenobacter amundsenii]